MNETLVVSSRGQITLPATLRKRLGIKGGDVMILEHRGDEIVLKPGTVVELQLYGDEQVARWDAEDVVSDEEKTRILDRLAEELAPQNTQRCECRGASSWAGGGWGRP